MHIEKFNSNQIGQILTHIERPLDRNYSNENIDKNKSKENYTFTFKNRDKGQKTLDYINDRVNEVKHLKRADTVKLVSIVINVPKDYKGDEKAFFGAVTMAFAKRYGIENIAYATVHKDETSPHMHLGVIPIIKTKDKNGNEIEKLCAKELFDRKEFKALHPEIERAVSERLKEPVHLLNGETEKDPETGKPYRDVKELKRKKEKERTELPRNMLGSVDYKKAYEMEQEKRIEQAEMLAQKEKENLDLKNKMYEQQKAINSLNYELSITRKQRDNARKCLTEERNKYDELASSPKLLQNRIDELNKPKSKERKRDDYER